MAFTALVAVPLNVHGGQAAAPVDPHAGHHPSQAAATTAAVPEPKADMMASMKASTAKLEELAKKMNAATGSARTDAIAELLTAIVQEHSTMQESMMSNKTPMKCGMNGMGGHGEDGTTTPAK
jgi:hypothetical protein